MADQTDADHAAIANAPRTPAMKHNARWGMVLFIIYLVIYGAFVALAAASPTDMMAKPALGGVNLAVVYGFALIIGAFVLAVIYLLISRE